MLRLAVVQSPADIETPAQRLDWLAGELQTIAAEKADLVLLPELFACGYNIADDILHRAEPVDGPTFGKIADMAVTHGIAIHYGFAEEHDGLIYNAAMCISSQGEVLCHQRKLAIPPGAERHYFTPGEGCRLFDLQGFRIATLICYDAEFPETFRHVAGLGADLVLVPTALGDQWSWVAHKMIPTRAFENGIFLAYCNHAGTENGMTYLGASVIAAPDGTELARAEKGTATIIGNLDRELVSFAQKRLPYLTDRHLIQF